MDFINWLQVIFGVAESECLMCVTVAIAGICLNFILAYARTVQNIAKRGACGTPQHSHGSQIHRIYHLQTSNWSDKGCSQ